MRVNYVIGFFLFSLGCFSIKADPFSFDEIEKVVESFDMQPPQFLSASDGIKLAYYSFVPTTHVDQPVVVLYPGAGLYGNKIYQWVAKTLHEKYGIGCYIFDLRGHGNSEGPRGDSPSIEQVWQDVDTALSFVKQRHLQAPVYLAGHSSGAGLLINYAAHSAGEREAGYLFLAPYLGPKSDTMHLNYGQYESFVKNVRVWVYILGSLFPYFGVTHWNAVFFNYPERVLSADSLIVPVYTYAMSCATTPYEIKTLLSKIAKPVGLLIGAQDEQFVPEKVVEWSGSIAAPVQSAIVKNAGHLSILIQAPELIANYVRKIS